MKQSRIINLIETAMVGIILTACGVPQASNPTPSTNGRSATSADSSASTDAKKASSSSSKQSKAEQQANLRREIQDKKDRLSRLQQDLSRKDGLVNSIEQRLASVSATRAQVVPEIPSSSVAAAAINQDTAGAIGAVVEKRTSEAAAAAQKVNLDALKVRITKDLATAIDELQNIEDQIDLLDKQIEDMTFDLNEIK